MDKIDLRILEILAQNCRIQANIIAKAVNLSKDTIIYRKRKLEQEGYFRTNMLFLDARKLGFTRHQIFIKFNSEANKEDLQNEIKKNPFVMWINTFIGKYDLHIIIDAKDSFHFESIKQNIFSLCDNKIQNFEILIHVFDLEFTNLNPDINLKTKFSKKDDFSFSSLLSPRRFPVDFNFDKYKPALYDVQILEALANNPTESLINLGRKIKIDRKTIKKRIANLIKNKVIIDFGGIPNLEKFGYVTYCLAIRLSQNVPHEILKSPFNELTNIFYAGKVNGQYDLLIYLSAKNPEELNSTIEIIRKRIGKYMYNYDLLVMDKVTYWKQYSRGIHDSLMNEAKS